MTTTFRLNRLLQASTLALLVGFISVGWTAPVGDETRDPAAGQPIAEQQAQDKAKAAEEKGRLPLEELRAFTEVMQRIKSAYVEEVDDKTLLESAIQGMLSGLDPHSDYLRPDDYKELEINTSGKFGGLGIEVGMEDGFIKVITPIDGTPADKAGIQSGDLIIKLDDTSVKGMSLMDSVDRMRGKPGDLIKLTIIREGETKPLDLVIKRDIIKVQSVRSRTLEEGFGYIRLSQFQADSDAELLAHMNKLKKAQKDEKLKGLVLDLRNNPGGVLQAAVGIVDSFIKEGLIVYTKGRIPNAELKFHATSSDPSQGVPLVVLINGGSASASEIVAGALQDHHRAVLLGTQSFGKGSVQTVLPLTVDAEKGLKLTTALYYTPSGRSIQAEGIKPDILLPRARITPIENTEQYKEANLQGHLSNGNKDDKKGNKGKAEEQPASSQSLAEQDYQLSQALNVLKGMHIGAWKKERKQNMENRQLAETDKS